MAAAPEMELITDRHYFSYDIDKRYAENALLDGGSTAGEELKAHVNNLAGQIHADLPRLDGYVHFRETYLHELCVIEKSLGSSHRVNRIKYIIPGLAPTAVLNVYDAPQTSHWTLGWIQACTHIDIRCIYTGGADEAVLVARASYRPFPDGLRMIHDGRARGYLDGESEAAPWTAKPVAINLNTGPAMDVEVPLLGTEFRSPLIPLATRSGRQLEIVRHNQGFYTWLVAMRTDERGEKIYKVLHMFRWNTHLQLTLDGRLQKGYKANLTALHLLTPRTVTPIFNRLAWRELDYAIANHHRGTTQTLFEKLEWKRILTPLNRNCTVSEPKWKMTPCPSTQGDSQGHSVLVSLESANANQPQETIRYSVVSLAVVRGTPVEVSSLLNNVEVSCDSYIRLHAAVRLQSGNGTSDAQALADWKVGWVQACYHSNLVRIYDNEHLVTGGRDGEMYRDNHPNYNEPKMWYNDSNDWAASCYGTRTAQQSNFDGLIEVTMEKKIMHRVEKTLQNSSKRLTALRIDAGYYSWLVAYNKNSHHLVRLAVVQWPLHIAAYRDPSILGNSEAWSLEDDGLRRTAWPLLAPLVPLPAEVVHCDPTHNPFFENDLSRYGTLGGADEHEAAQVAASEVNSCRGAAVRAKVVSGLVPVVAALVHSGFRPPMLTTAAGDHLTATAAASTQQPLPRQPPVTEPHPPSRDILPSKMADAASTAPSSAPCPSPVPPQAASPERNDKAMRSPARTGGEAAKATVAAGARSPPNVRASLPRPLSPPTITKNGLMRVPQVATPPRFEAPDSSASSSPTLTPSAPSADSKSETAGTRHVHPPIDAYRYFGPNPSLREYKPMMNSSWRTGSSYGTDEPTEFDRGYVRYIDLQRSKNDTTKAAEAPHTPSEPNVQSASSKSESSETLKVSTYTATDKVAETSPPPKASSALFAPGESKDSAASKVTLTKALVAGAAEKTAAPFAQPMTSQSSSKTLSIPSNDDALGSSKVIPSNLTKAATTTGVETPLESKAPPAQPPTFRELSYIPPDPKDENVVPPTMTPEWMDELMAIRAQYMKSKQPKITPETLARVAAAAETPAWFKARNMDRDAIITPRFSSHRAAADQAASVSSVAQTPSALDTLSHSKKDETSGELKTISTVSAGAAATAEAPSVPTVSSPQPVMSPTSSKMSSFTDKDNALEASKVKTSTLAISATNAAVETSLVPMSPSSQPMASVEMSEIPLVPEKTVTTTTSNMISPTLAKASTAVDQKTPAALKTPSMQSPSTMPSKTTSTPGKDDALEGSKVTTHSSATTNAAAHTLAASKTSLPQPVMTSTTPSTPGMGEISKASTVSSTVPTSVASEAADSPSPLKTPLMQPITSQSKTPVPGKHAASSATVHIAHPATSGVITSGTGTSQTMATSKTPSLLVHSGQSVASPTSHMPAPAPLVNIGTASVVPGASMTSEMAPDVASAATASGMSASKQGASVSKTVAAACGSVSPMAQRDVRKRSGPSVALATQPKAATVAAKAEMLPTTPVATPPPQDLVSVVASDAALKFAEFQDERQPGETDVLRESIMVPVGQCLERDSVEEYLRKYGGRLPNVGLTPEPPLGILLRAVGITRLPSMNRQAPPSEKTGSPPRSETL